jgi:hypothetical protein
LAAALRTGHAWASSAFAWPRRSSSPARGGRNSSRSISSRATSTCATARASGAAVRYERVPEQMLAIARISDIDELLTAGS